MTSINSTNSSSTALLLLRGASLRSSNGNQKAGGTSPAATSNNSDAAIATIKRLASEWEATKASQTVRTSSEINAGGTVSSAASSAWLSGMASVGAATMGASQNTAEIGAGGTSIARTVENAEAVVGVLARAVNDYNGKFELQEIPTQEEHEASKDSAIATWVAKGMSEEQIAKNLKFGYGEAGYERLVRDIENHNQGLLRSSELAVDAISGSTDHLKGAFGVKVQISYDEESHASVGAFDINYRNGQKMLSYGADGSLTSYNEDGTVKLALSNKEAAKIPMGYYRS